MDATVETSLTTWNAPECSYTIAYSPRVLDDIRLAVADAFFSLPRGGVEIGGILLGRRETERVTVTGYAPLECEHAFGPSFNLSPNDHAKLARLIAEATRDAAGDQVVGWYHSHTRSELFFPAADQEIHRQFFPEPWQIALVVKPHAFQPTRAGFFFRNANGSFDGEACRQEFVLQPMAPAPARRQAPPEPRPSEPVAPSEKGANIPAVSVPAIVLPPAAVLPVAVPRDNGSAAQAVEPARVPIVREPPVPHFEVPRVPPIEPPVEVPVPGFVTAEAPPVRKWRAVLLVLLGSAVGGTVYQTQSLWWPSLSAVFHRPDNPSSKIALTTIDHQGQLQIRWDGASDVVRNAQGGTLVINDGSAPLIVALTPAQLQNGSFTFARQTERVDVTLKVPGSSGSPVQSVTTFFGKLPPPEDPALRAERDRLAHEAEKLKTDLSQQAERTRRLEQSVESMRKEMRERGGRMEPDSATSPETKQEPPR